MNEEIRLTKFSKGAGCGCKIAPADLEEILSGQKSVGSEKLLVGNNTGDDAAVYDMGDGRAVISTVDFFLPIVDDAYDFGRISATNAISDVYAMGGKPLFANAILGWPVERLPKELASKLLEGARSVCDSAGVIMAGGHSIDSADPIFGLSVNGEVAIENLKRNSTAALGDSLYLTKPLGFGIVTTAHKRGVADDIDFQNALNQMLKLNSAGERYGAMKGVSAMTDVTGFGLLGHLTEMCEAAGLSAVIEYDKIPLLENLQSYISKLIYPDITFRNWKAVENGVDGIGPDSLLVLCDPQTSGGLLVAVGNENIQEFEELNTSLGQEVFKIGTFRKRSETLIEIA